MTVYATDSRIRWVYRCGAPGCPWVSDAYLDQMPEVAGEGRTCHPGYRLQEVKVARFDCTVCTRSGVAESRWLPEHVSPEVHTGELGDVARWWAQ